MKDLRELHLNHQQTEAKFEIAESSVAAIARSLRVLELSGCNLVDILLLGFMTAIQTLDISHNPIQDARELTEVCRGCTSLQSLNVQETPVNTAAKLRELVILHSPSLSKCIICCILSFCR
jgi:Leucine-rich repeat (LRR) protein